MKLVCTRCTDRMLVSKSDSYIEPAISVLRHADKTLNVNVHNVLVNKCIAQC